MRTLQVALFRNTISRNSAQHWSSFCTSVLTWATFGASQTPLSQRTSRGRRGFARPREEMGELDAREWSRVVGGVVVGEDGGDGGGNAGAAVGAALGGGVDMNGGAGMGGGKRGKGGEAMLVGCRGGSAGGVGERGDLCDEVPSFWQGHWERHAHGHRVGCSVVASRGLGESFWRKQPDSPHTS